MKNEKSIEKLLKPHSIAIVGASDKTGKVGNMLVKNIANSSYLGEVFFVNNRSHEIEGREVYSSVSEIPKDSVDLVVIATPAFTVLDIVESASEKCSQFIIISAGFGESTEEGQIREKKLNELAEEKNLTILGPNCLGILSPEWGLNASFAPSLPPKGDTAFISQSGALAVALIDKAKVLNVGFSHVISIGNKMHISETNLIKYFANDKSTKTIILYLESIVGGIDFLGAVRDARLAGKRVIILKSGKSDEAQEAIALHTGSLTSGDVVTEAVFKKMGIIRAHTINDIFVLASLSHILPIGKKISNIAVITNAGGPGVITTDEISICRNLHQAMLSEENMKELSEKLPNAASVHNPIDLLGDAKLGRYMDAIKICIKDENIDAIMVLLTPQDGTPSGEVAKFIVEEQKNTDKLIITSFIGGESVKNSQKILREGNVFHVGTPTWVVDVLNELVANDSFEIPELNEVNQEDGINKKTEKILNISSNDNNRGLYFHEVKEIAREYNIPISKSWDVTGGLGVDTHVVYPCVVKVDNPNILHKSDREGVILPIKTPHELIKAITLLKNRFTESNTKIIAQPLAKIQIELIVGMKQDPVFGSIVIVGIGGIYTEIIKKTEVFVTPISEEEIEKRMITGKLSFLFVGERGQRPYNISDVVDIVMALQNVSMKNKTIKEIDINPLLIYNNGTNPNAVDMKIVF